MTARRLGLAFLFLLASPAFAQQGMPTARQGGLVTFAQPVVVLDANGNPVSGGGSASYAAPGTTASVTTSSTSILSGSTYTRLIVLVTAPSCAGNVWLNLAGGTAVSGQGLFIPAGGGSVSFGSVLPIPTAAINGISDSGTCAVSIQGA